MRNGHDITCEAPMGEDLHYQITTYLIEAIAKGDARMYHTRITAEVDHSELPLSLIHIYIRIMLLAVWNALKRDENAY